ncbi:Os05g0500950, partial [Oryza sativa Japonica Group]
LVAAGAPFGALGAEVGGLHPAVEQLDDGARAHAARRLVLVDGRAAAERVVHELVERAVRHDADLQRPDRPVGGAALAVHAVEPFLDGEAAVLEHRRRHRRPARRRPELPEQHVVARDGGRRVGVARVLHQRRPERRQVLHRLGHRRVQLRLVRLVGVDAEGHVLPPHEGEHGRRVLEPGHAQHVAHAVAVQAGVGGDDELVLVSELDVDEVDEAAVVGLRGGDVVGAGVDGEELEVAHCWDEGVGDLAGLAHGVEVEAEVALGGGVHGAGERQPAAVELQCRDVLRHGAGDDDVDVLGAGPHPPDDALPRRPRALRLDRVGERRVGAAEHPPDGAAHGGVGDPAVELPRADVAAQARPVLLQEADRAEEARREHRADAEHVGAVDEAADELRVHALVRVLAQHRLVGARVHRVRVVRPLEEVAAPVEARQHGPRRQPARRAPLRLDEVEVHGLALVQPGHLPAHHRHQQAVQPRPPLHLLLYRRHQLPLPTRPHLPGEELADGLAGEDGRGVAVGDAEDVGEDVLVRDERRQTAERLVGARRVARHAEAAQVLGLRVLRQDLLQHAALLLPRVPRHALDVLELLPVLRAHRRRRRRRRRHRGRYRLRHGTRVV